MARAGAGFRLGTLRNMRRRDLLLAALAPGKSPNLRDVAAIHVTIAEKDKGRRKIWGRIGGPPSEHESSAALVKQLTPFLPKVELEPVDFTAHPASERNMKHGAQLL